VPNRRVLSGLLAMLVVLGVCVWALWPQSAITRENAAKIQKGMTLAEVEAILGEPPRDDNDPDLPTFGSLRRPSCWLADGLLVSVVFDTTGRVASCDSSTVPIPNPLEKLRRWLRL
jgi:hypothetical protein